MRFFSNNSLTLIERKQNNLSLSQKTLLRRIFTQREQQQQKQKRTKVYGNKRKTHVNSAVPSKSPIAVRYGMQTLSGSRSCRQTNVTIH